MTYKPTKGQKAALKRQGYMPNTELQELTIAKIRRRKGVRGEYSVKVNKRTGVSTVTYMVSKRMKKPPGMFSVWRKAKITPRGKILKK